VQDKAPREKPASTRASVTGEEVSWASTTPTATAAAAMHPVDQARSEVQLVQAIIKRYFKHDLFIMVSSTLQNCFCRIKTCTRISDEEEV
jgi:hypothetical protein